MSGGTKAWKCISNKTSVLETVSQNLKLAAEEVSSHLEGVPVLVVRQASLVTTKTTPAPPPSCALGGEVVRLVVPPLSFILQYVRILKAVSTRR